MVGPVDHTLTQYQLALALLEVQQPEAEGEKPNISSAIASDALAIASQDSREVTIQEMTDPQQGTLIIRPFMHFTYWEIAGGALILVVIITLSASVLIGIVMYIHKMLCGGNKDEFLV